jgi:hypothetical protein
MVLADGFVYIYLSNHCAIPYIVDITDTILYLFCKKADNADLGITRR